MQRGVAEVSYGGTLAPHSVSTVPVAATAVAASAGRALTEVVETQAGGTVAIPKRPLGSPTTRERVSVRTTPSEANPSGVGRQTSPDAAKANPLAGTTYTGKVRAQMRPNLKTGRPDNHGFPLEVDNSAGLGRQTTIKGGDGVSSKKIELDGSYNGQQGRFEWIVEPNGTVNHRLFVPTPGVAP